tara:strand:+ start:632 stop:1372 length:741 start_codon:yes stop_codon:yes gene_type:complete
MIYESTMGLLQDLIKEVAIEVIEESKSVFSIINIEDVTSISDKYPEDFMIFCNDNNISPPKINTGRGKALSTMLDNPYNYFTRQECNDFCIKFCIKTNDSIQLFNKHEQWGIKCSSSKGKYYIKKPYTKTKKYEMRKNFKFDGSLDSKNKEISNIKSHLIENYIDISNEKWELGHKNPDIEDSSSNNLVLQPPIQGKYRDNYIFIDTFTKIPTPKKLKSLIETKVSPYSNQQLIELKHYLNSLNLE